MLPNLIYKEQAGNGKKDKPIYIINKWNCRRQKQEKRKSWKHGHLTNLLFYLLFFGCRLIYNCSCIDLPGDILALSRGAAALLSQSGSLVPVANSRRKTLREREETLLRNTLRWKSCKSKICLIQETCRKEKSTRTTYSCLNNLFRREVVWVDERINMCLSGGKHKIFFLCRRSLSASPRINFWFEVIYFEEKEVKRTTLNENTSWLTSIKQSERRSTRMQACGRDKSIFRRKKTFRPRWMLRTFYCVCNEKFPATREIVLETSKYKNLFVRNLCSSLQQQTASVCTEVHSENIENGCWKLFLLIYYKSDNDLVFFFPMSFDRTVHGGKLKLGIFGVDSFISISSHAMNKKLLDFSLLCLVWTNKLATVIARYRLRKQENHELLWTFFVIVKAVLVASSERRWKHFIYSFELFWREVKFKISRANSRSGNFKIYNFLHSMSRLKLKIRFWSQREFQKMKFWLPSYECQGLKLRWFWSQSMLFHFPF